LDDLRDLLQLEFQRLGFRYFACASTVGLERPASGAVVLHNYPTSWVQRYRAAQYLRRDPVLLVGRDIALPFLWDDQAFRARMETDQIAILNDAASHGLLYGATIPLHGAGGVSASCSLIAEEPGIDGDRVHLAARYALYAYQAGRRLAHPDSRRPKIALPRRERQCMELVALGKDDEAIAIILGIDRETVRRYVETAKARLNATKRPHAVAYAIYTQAISLDALFGS
jgi:LuxR family transcriptional regulator, activator of conjugal transfer of Ti plasmids